MYKILYSPQSLKALAKALKNISSFIIEKIHRLAENPFAAPNVKNLKDDLVIGYELVTGVLFMKSTMAPLSCSSLILDQGAESMTNSAQIIHDAAGEPAFAVLPIAAFERLMDAADEAWAIHAYDSAKTNAQEFFPDSVATRLIAGENPLRIFRDHRGVSIEALAATVGLTAQALAALEAGEQSLTTALAARLAAALQLDPDLLTLADARS